MSFEHLNEQILSRESEHSSKSIYSIIYSMVEDRFNYLDIVVYLMLVDILIVYIDKFVLMLDVEYIEHHY